MGERERIEGRLDSLERLPIAWRQDVSGGWVGSRAGSLEVQDVTSSRTKFTMSLSSVFSSPLVLLSLLEL